MALLIIIRGPPGSGKTEVGNALKRRLKLENQTLQLDEIMPDVFDKNVSAVLDEEYIVGEMHYGNSHTTKPIWLDKFTEKGFTIISAVLQIKFETCIIRAVGRPVKPLDPFDAINQYFLFYSKYKQIFISYTGIKEICIECDNRSAEQIADEILNLLA
ncbi:MAG: hypothetical protein WA364_27355 [Candidatus Nitrosopolaris sp.]